MSSHGLDSEVEVKQVVLGEETQDKKVSDCKHMVQIILGRVDQPESEQSQLMELLCEYQEAFKGERGETSLVELEIDTGSTIPKRQRVRRMHYAVRTEVAKQLKSMRDVGVVQPSSSPWASPVVMVCKKDGSH